MKTDCGLKGLYPCKCGRIFEYGAVCTYGGWLRVQQIAWHVGTERDANRWGGHADYVSGDVELEVSGPRDVCKL